MPRVVLLLEHYHTMPGGLQLYSIRQDEPGQISMAADFYNRMSRHLKERPDLQSHWEAFSTNLDRLDQRQTSLLQLNWLRDEGKAYALPSKASQFHRLGLRPPIDFRLYCFPAGPRTLILFNGDVKTHADPNLCPQVGPYFRQARRLAHYLQQLQDEWEIGPDHQLSPDPLAFDYQ